MALTASNTVNDAITQLQDLQGLNNKADLASTIGSPTSASDTMASMITALQTDKNNLASKLAALGISSLGTESMDSLVGKVSNLKPTSAYAPGEWIPVSSITGSSFMPVISHDDTNHKNACDYDPTEGAVYTIDRLNGYLYKHIGNTLIWSKTFGSYNSMSVRVNPNLGRVYVLYSNVVTYYTTSGVQGKTVNIGAGDNGYPTDQCCLDIDANDNVYAMAAGIAISKMDKDLNGVIGTATLAGPNYIYNLSVGATTLAVLAGGTATCYTYNLSNMAFIKSISFAGYVGGVYVDRLNDDVYYVTLNDLTVRQMATGTLTVKAQTTFPSMSSGVPSVAVDKDYVYLTNYYNLYRYIKPFSSRVTMYTDEGMQYIVTAVDNESYVATANPYTQGSVRNGNGLVFVRRLKVK